jgi:hypothetical protein
MTGFNLPLGRLRPASAEQRAFVAKLLGQEPVVELTNGDAQHIIGAYHNRPSRQPHVHELEAIMRALGLKWQSTTDGRG